jgi:TPR repeat protein
MLLLAIWVSTASAAPAPAPAKSSAPAPVTAPWLETMKESCTKGSTQDCLNVGVAYMTGELNGNKIAKNPKQAKLYIDDGLRMGEQRCKQGDYVDCYTIGLMYFEGGVIPTDLPRGLNYLQKSCKGGYKKACDWLDNSGLGSMIK